MLYAPPPWLKLSAIPELNKFIKEMPGDEFNPEILKYWNYCQRNTVSDETPWCAAFVGWCLEERGIQSTRLPNARSYESWGIERKTVGSITVLWRDNPSSWKGHVGFLTFWGEDFVWLLGGNQHNAVTIMPYPINRVIGYRWPV